MISYLASIGVTIGIYALLALGINVAWGLTGMDDEADQMQRLSGFLIRSAATKAEATRRDNKNTLHLLFEH